MNLTPVLRHRYFDSNGAPLAGGKLYTYQAETTTLQATYTDQGGGTAQTNPIILDANGEAEFWADPTLSYKYVLYDANDVEQWSIDKVLGLLSPDAVNTASIQDGAVTTAKIADDAVTSAKLQDDASVDANRAVTTDHIRDSAITISKIASGPLLSPGTYNIGLAAATTSESNDSIKITGATAALSSSNPGVIALPSNTPGLLTYFKLTADVTINLTGAHFGFGGGGDLSDQQLSVYGINDDDNIRFGVAYDNAMTSISGSNDETTQSNVTTFDKVLVNTALSGSSACLEIGWFKADFDDTGGASEDLWAIQTGVGDVNLGPAPAAAHIIEVHTPSGHGSSGTTTRKFSVTQTSLGGAITYTQDATNGDYFTINQAGHYTINYSDRKSSGTSPGGISLNSSSTSTAFNSLAAGEQVQGTDFNTRASVSARIFIPAGGVIRAQTDGSANGTAAMDRFRISRG